MANEESKPSGDDRAKREARPAETGKSKGYSRPTRDGAKPPRSASAGSSHSGDQRGGRNSGASSSTSRPLNSSSRPPAGGSGDRGASAGSSGGEARGYQGRPSSSRDGERASGGYQGRPSSSRDGERPSGGYQGRPSSSRDGERPSGGYQGRPDRAAADRGAPPRGGDSRSNQGRPDRSSPGRPPQRTGYLGKGAPKHQGAQRDDEDRAPRNEGLVRKAPIAPEIPDEVTFDLLDKAARARLRTLSKDNAEDVGRHLIMAGRLIDIDPERAHQHALVAVARGGRVDIVREAAALTAYASGRYADALREFRTVRRLNGSSEHLALMADCERGLGRPERAIALAQEPEAKQLEAESAVEMQIVIAGARMDMGNAEAALMTLTRIETKDPQARARIAEAKVSVLRALDRNTEADELEAQLPTGDEPDLTWADEVFLYDVEELPEPFEAEAAEAESADDPGDVAPEQDPASSSAKAADDA